MHPLFVAIYSRVSAFSRRHCMKYRRPPGRLALRRSIAATELETRRLTRNAIPITTCEPYASWERDILYAPVSDIGMYLERNSAVRHNSWANEAVSRRSEESQRIRLTKDNEVIEMMRTPPPVYTRAGGPSGSSTRDHSRTSSRSVSRAPLVPVKDQNHRVMQGAHATGGQRDGAECGSRFQLHPAPAYS